MEEELLHVLRSTKELLKLQAKMSEDQHAEFMATLHQMNTSNDKRPELTIEALSGTIELFTYDPDNNVTFDIWFAKYEDVFREDAKALDDAGRTRLLLRRLDNIAHARYVNYILPSAPRDKKFDETVSVLRTIFGRGESLFGRRWKCLQMQKRESDDYTTYAATVNRACEDFQFSTVTPDYFKCLIYLLGLQGDAHKDVRTRLLNKLETEDISNLNLELMVTESKRLLCLKKDSARIESSVKQEPASVNKVHTKKPFKKDSQQKQKKTPSSPCWLCGAMHYVRECTFKNHTCSECGSKGHREGYCGLGESHKKKLKGKKQPQQRSQVNMVANAPSGRKYIAVTINNSPLSLLYDTGSDLTIISQENWIQLGSPPLTPTRDHPHDAQGNTIRLLGEFYPSISCNNINNRSGRCVVAEANINLFGTDWITLFNLWDTPITKICNHVSTSDFIASLKDNYPRVFSSTLGKCTKGQVSLQLKQNATPVFRPKRPVPFHLMEMVEDELQRLVNLQIITPVDYSDYAAPIVVARKPNGKIRICADYSTGLNEILEFHHYPIPTPTQIFASLGNNSVFSQLDLSDAYLQLEMDEPSRKILTINTHRGLFTFNRLCPGIKSAPGIFQQTVDTMLQGITGVSAYFDDILVASSTVQGHMDSLNKIFQRLEDFDFRVRLEKCKFFQSELKFLGIIINGQGQHPDPAKISAIVSMPEPSNINELRSFLGAVTFYSKFVNSMSTLRAPLDRLFRANAQWKWTSDCQHAFNQLKAILSSNLLLTHYDPVLPITVAGDASEVGIGCVGYHTYPDGSVKAFHHASRTLTDTEKRYSQIEKEGLALIFAVTKLHQYIFGRKFILHTDHKPLLAIFGSKKGIPTHSANRLQRWGLTLLSYSFEIKYINTDSFGYADVLSRLIAAQSKDEQDDFIVAEVKQEDFLKRELGCSISQFSPVTFKRVQECTAACTTLQKVIKFVQSGWPSAKKNITSSEVQSFFDLKNSLTLTRTCLLYRDRLVIPQPLRKDILKTLHSGHPGIVRMKALARCFVYWPGIDEDIKSVVKTCSLCALAARSPVTCELFSWPICTRPWQRVHIDFAGPVDGVSFFIMIDAFSKWPEVFITKSISTSATISWMWESCSRYGFMEVLVSDNGTQFTSSAFSQFCETHGIKHIRTSPYHPQSNGLAERFVDTLKRGLKKNSDITDTSQALQTFLMAYRNTPNENTHNGAAPAQLIFGRSLRTQLALLKPIEEQSQLRNTKMEEQFNLKHGARSRSFEEGERVYVKIFKQNGFKWEPGRIIERIGSVNYNIEVFLSSANKLIRAHINQINPRSVPDGNSADTSLELVDLLDDSHPKPEHPTDTDQMPDSTPTTSRPSRFRVNPRHPTRTSLPFLRSRVRQ
ncbi:uncharacterized protein K02A2.6-like [Phlebotomus papatasi]|uniref:uncharacterized protein K02A2.6-like n=1 Tax=Phlebotomus papatasi TaxID=29031 RepID=UPI0024845FEB|nr:uncharacterized protein K02A2.6-like [Phlebotomus papatasi]